MPRTLRWSVAAAVACFAAPLSAQSIHAQSERAPLAAAETQAPNAASAGADTTTQAAPSANVAPVGFHYAAPARTQSAMAASRSNIGLGQARALMIVGAAGILVGAIVGGNGGTVIMLSGAVVGLVGLYEYTK